MFYISVILLAALIAVQIAKKSGIPSLMLFLSLGIISSLIGYKFDDYQFAENFSKIALLIINSIHIGSHLYVITDRNVNSLCSSFWLDREFLNRFYHWFYRLCVRIKYPFFKEFKFEIQYGISFRT